jgi:aerobic carbon-monoxide dehydrogenase large subunit
MAQQVGQRYTGTPVKRAEDPRILTGRGRYIDDVSLPGMLHATFARSPLPHARITSIDTTAAGELPGVVAVYTGAEMESRLQSGPYGIQVLMGGAVQPTFTAIATDKVRLVGDPVALVVAETRYVAEDAAELIEVDYEDLPAIATADDALDPSSPIIFEELGSNVLVSGVSNVFGDVDDAFARADRVVRASIAQHRHQNVPMETRGTVASFDPATGALNVWTGNQGVSHVQMVLAARLDLPAEQIRVRAQDIGGSFGLKIAATREDVAVAAASRDLGRPVKWIEDRREHLMAANHSRQQRHQVRAAVDGDGRLLALDDVFYHDQGGYVRTHAATVPDLAATMLPGPYRVPTYRASGRIRLTNKTPGGTYRAPGRFESTFARERAMDAVATRLGLDPVEVRRRNLIDKSEFPYALPFTALGADIVFDSGDYAGLLDRALAAVGWDRLQAVLSLRRANGEAVGAGLAMFVEKSGLGPYECVRVSVDETGAVELVTGAASVGQGVETVLAQICADGLGVDYRRVRVIHGQTDRIAYGVGAFRVTVMSGEATRRAAVAARAKAIALAAVLLQRDAAALTVADGRVVTAAGDAGPSITLGDIARALAPASKLRGEREPGLAADGWFHTDHMNYPYGVHIAVARVDRETGGVTVERFLAAYDIGKAVNPMLVEGQIAGGFAQGIGGTLMEEFCYDAQGEPLSVTFVDYAMPTAREIPSLDVLISEDAPSPLNSLGVKGAGEAGINAVGAAIASAIDAAIEMPGAVTRLPVTPQRLREILRGS